MSKSSHCIFEYLYRDAGNYKAWGELLLEGKLSDADTALLRNRFDGGELFIAEQIGVPTLYQKLWSECGSGPSEDDHGWHEFHGVRQALSADLISMSLWGKATDLIAAVQNVKKWNESLSTNQDGG